MQNSQINPYRITAAKQVQLTSTIVEWKYHLLFEGRNRGGAIWSHKGCCQFSAADVEWYFLNRLSSTVTNQRSDLHAEVSTILMSIVFVHYVGKIVARAPMPTVTCCCIIKENAVICVGIRDSILLSLIYCCHSSLVHSWISHNTQTV